MTNLCIHMDRVVKSVGIGTSGKIPSRFIAWGNIRNMNLSKVVLNLSLFVLLTVVIGSCTSRPVSTGPLTFPADTNQPFLTLEHTLGEDVPISQGLFSSLLRKITGEHNLVPILRPSAVAVSNSGQVYVLDTDGVQVLRYSFENNLLTSVETYALGGLQMPIGIAISDQIVFISDANSAKIYRFSLTLEPMGSFIVDGLQRPGQIKIHPKTGNLYVVDTPSHQILVLDATGTIVGRIHNDEIDRKVLVAPISVDFTGSGKIAVVDGMTRKVEFFSEDYQYLSGFGGYDRVPGSFSYPRGLAISSDGYVFVSDAAFGNIQIFDPSGALLYYFGEIGKEAGEFLLPAALTIDRQDKLYVVDQYNNRIQVFQYYAQEK